MAGVHADHRHHHGYHSNRRPIAWRWWNCRQRSANTPGFVGIDAGIRAVSRHHGQCRRGICLDGCRRGSGADCTPEQLRDHDLLAWADRVNALLPGADAWIITGADDGENPVDIAITMVWSQNRGFSPANTETFNFKLMGFDQ